jgi:arylsulfatase A-like enzyme
MSKSDRPNILFVLTDDQGCWAMGCAGNDEIRTPNLDRLAETGTRFENFFCVSPVCSPARASILTGEIPSRHGIHDYLRAGNYTGEPNHRRLVEYLEGQTGYTDILAENGYRCGLSGKWHMGNSHKPQMGFSLWQVHGSGGSNYYGAPMIRDGELYRPEEYVTDHITDNALAFLDELAQSQEPFHLNVHYTAPHSPWKRDQHPKETYDDYLENCPFQSTPNVPLHPWQINSAPKPKDERTRKEILSGYFTAITEMDRSVGRLLDRLEEKGLRENTLVVFTGDNGMNMGHHGIYGKGNGTFPLNMYDTSVKVPVIISRPGHVPEGAVNGNLLSHYDVMPTILEYLGMEDPGAGDRPGTSFAPLLRGEELKGRDSVVVYDEYGPVRMIRTREWKYVHRYPYGPNELYDLANDPGEEKNLVDGEEHADRVKELRDGLEEWFLRYADPVKDGARLPVTGKGQVDVVGPDSEAPVTFMGDWKYITPGK